MDDREDQTRPVTVTEERRLKLQRRALLATDRLNGRRTKAFTSRLEQ